MHDCPGCGVTLHGHESNCPSCGTRQPVSPYLGAEVPPDPGIDMRPIYIASGVLAIGVYFLIQSTWVGELIRERLKRPSAEETMIYVDARKLMENKINQGIKDGGFKGYLTWKSGAGKADINTSNSVDLAVEVNLKSPDQRQAIFDPVKQYMEKGKVSTMTVTAPWLHATWTYTVSSTPPETPEQTDE